jgi:hypothetical protein
VQNIGGKIALAGTFWRDKLVGVILLEHGLNGYPVQNIGGKIALAGAVKGETRREKCKKHIFYTFPCVWLRLRAWAWVFWLDFTWAWPLRLKHGPYGYPVQNIGVIFRIFDLIFHRQSWYKHFYSQAFYSCRIKCLRIKMLMQNTHKHFINAHRCPPPSASLYYVSVISVFVYSTALSTWLLSMAFKYGLYG